MEEFKIQEDFFHISELVESENAFINRTTQIDSITRSLSNTYLNVPYLTDEDVLFYERFFTEYLGSPALLSEKLFASRQSVLFVYQALISWGSMSINNGNFAEEMDFWILGSSYNDTLRIDANDDVKCGAQSCYEQSLESGKICKPGL